MAHPSLLTAVTAMDSAVASLSHGTTMAATWPWPRAYSSIARDTTRGDPFAMNSKTPPGIADLGLRIADCGLRIELKIGCFKSRPAIPIRNLIRNPHSAIRNVLKWPGGRTSQAGESDTRSAACQAAWRFPAAA